MAYLLLVRHGKSEWNLLGKWTGFTDVSLIPQGREEAQRAAEAMRDISIDSAFVSDLKRAQETLAEICKALKREDMKVTIDPAIKERNYGAYTGKNKWEVQKEIGDEAFQNLRRGWDVPIPEGESLKDVHARVMPYYESTIKPLLKEGKNVLVVAHGNSLRALVKHLEGISEANVGEIEIGTGEVWCYKLDGEGKIVEKTIRSLNEEKLKV